LIEDAVWAFFEPFLVSVRGRGGPPASNHRLVLYGIFWIGRKGAAWRDLPQEFGKWSSVYRQFRRWTLAGLWELVLNALNDSDVVQDGVQMIDSTVIRAHHLAAGAEGGLENRVLAVQKVSREMGWLPPSQTASQCAKIVVITATERKGRQP
jgi:transposase